MVEFTIEKQYTIEEVASKTGMSERSLREEVKDGNLESIKRRERIYISESALKAYLGIFNEGSPTPVLHQNDGSASQDLPEDSTTEASLVEKTVVSEDIPQIKTETTEPPVVPSSDILVAEYKRGYTDGLQDNLSSVASVLDSTIAKITADRDALATQLTDIQKQFKEASEAWDEERTSVQDASNKIARSNERVNEELESRAKWEQKVKETAAVQESMKTTQVYEYFRLKLGDKKFNRISDYKFNGEYYQ